MTDRVGYRPNEIDLISVTLHNFAGNKIDIRHMMAEFNIYFDLTANGNLAEFVMTDSNGLIDLLPIVGQETIQITFRTPTFDTKKTFVFSIYKISQREKKSQRLETYVLHGISQEVMLSYRKSVNKSFRDIKASTAIKAIYDDYLDPSLNFSIYRPKTLNVQETNGNIHVVFPGVTPFEAIRYLSQEAQSLSDDSQASNFVFYEGNSNWNFTTLDDLLVQNPVEDFFYSDSAIEDSVNDEESPKKLQKIHNLDYSKELDTIDKMDTGLYNHAVETIDPILKKYRYDSFRYNKDFNKIAHIESNKVVQDDSFYTIEDESTRSYLIFSNIGENYGRQSFLSSARSRDPQIRNPRRLHSFLKYDIASRIQLTNVMINVTIPGNTDLQVGDVVNLHIPLANQERENIGKENLLYKRKFMIMSMRHTYNKVDNSFFTVLECVKDSYAKSIKEDV